MTVEERDERARQYEADAQMLRSVLAAQAQTIEHEPSSIDDEDSVFS